MNAAGRLATFAAAVGLVFCSAAAVGRAVGPIDVGVDTASHADHGGDAGGTNVESRPKGLAVADAGFRLVVDSPTVIPGEASSFGFSIVDAQGVPVTDFDQLHERALHLVVLSRNLVDYLHVHPVMGADGHWTIDLPALAPGSYRVFTDFQPTGAANVTLGADIIVPGELRAIGLPDPRPVTVVDGYTVTIDGSPEVGDSELRFRVETGGQIVRPEPYLGASGHLVAIRVGDLAYLHVHPHDDDTGPVVAFTGEFPTPGTYRLFFDFSHDGRVRTAAFTVEVPEAGGH